MNLTINESEVEDIDEMHRLDQLCFKPPFAFQKSTFQFLLNRLDTISLLARTGPDQLVGFVILEAFPPNSHCVSTLDVHPDYRHRGIGRDLLRQALSRARQRGLFKSYLQVYVENEDALAFYKSLGYRVLGLLHDYYGQGINGFLMLLDHPKEVGLNG